MADRDDDFDDFRDSFYYRAIRTRLGAALRAQFDLSQPLPDRIAALLTRFGKEEAPSEPAETARATDGEPAGGAGR